MSATAYGVGVGGDGGFRNGGVIVLDGGGGGVGGLGLGPAECGIVALCGRNVE